jgi:hypothetical protein
MKCKRDSILSGITIQKKCDTRIERDSLKDYEQPLRV